MKIINETKNELFNRNEVTVELTSEKNPSFSDISKKISEKFSKPEEDIDVFSIKGGFGTNVFLAKAYVYHSRKDLEKAIQKSKKQRVLEKKDLEEQKKKAEEDAKAATGQSV
jgi:ribosomal protein S24E